MAPTADNPAGRLYLLMTRARGLANGSTSIHFPALLSYEQSDTITMYGRLAAVLKTVDETEQLLKTYDMGFCEMFLAEKQLIVNFFANGINSEAEWTSISPII